jgi:hypothetical protein
MSEKKAPGRPKKISKIPPIKVEGIVSEPKNDDSKIEFMYQTPILFKKLLQAFIKIRILEIHIFFHPDKISIRANNCNGQINIYVEFDCSKVCRYYCDAPMHIGITCKEAQIAFNDINKTSIATTLVLKKEDFRQKLYIYGGGSNNGMSYVSESTITLLNISDGDMKEVVTPCISDYPVIFKIATSHLKQNINCLTSGRQLCISKVPNKPLEMIFIGETAKKFTYDKPEEINLICKNEEDDITIVNVLAGNIKKFISVQITDTIHIYAHPNNKLMLMYELPQGTIKFFANIIDTRIEDGVKTIDINDVDNDESESEPIVVQPKKTRARRRTARKALEDDDEDDD